MKVTDALTQNLQDFIEEQPLFFVASADVTGHVNISPKGLDTLRVIDHHRICWLNLSGSGNETAAHVQATGRMTLMFCAFQGPAKILRIYGQATVKHPRDPDWEQLMSDFPEFAGSRQIFDLSIERVQISCGTGVPLMAFQSSRGEEQLLPFYEKMGPEGVKEYWARKNSMTIDNKPTGILDDLQS